MQAGNTIRPASKVQSRVCLCPTSWISTLKTLQIIQGLNPRKRQADQCFVKFNTTIKIMNFLIEYIRVSIGELFDQKGAGRLDNIDIGQFIEIKNRYGTVIIIDRGNTYSYTKFLG